MEVLEQVSKGLRLSKPDNCPVEMWEIIESCWNSNPAARPTFSKLSEQIEIYFAGLNSDEKYQNVNHNYQNQENNKEHEYHNESKEQKYHTVNNSEKSNVVSVVDIIEYQ